MATRCPFAAWRPITENIYRGGRQKIRGFVPHVQVGTGSLFGFFNTRKPPGQGASADFWCSKTGVLEQYVDLADQAWAQGSHEHNGNPFFVSCEFEGQPGEPMTDAQIARGGELIAWLRENVNDFPLQVNTDPNGYGITPHHVFGGGHTCPGPGPREGQFPLLVAAAQPAAPQPPPPHQEDDMIAASFVIFSDDDIGKAQGPVYLAGRVGGVAHVDNFAHARDVAHRHGITVVPPPDDGKQQVTDGNGNTEWVWIVKKADAPLFGMIA